jgi:hypothetical protein
VKPLFKVQLEVTALGCWFSLSTPTWADRTNPQHRPSLWPRVTRYDYGSLCESRHALHLDWFFHLVVAWGEPDSGVPAEQADCAGGLLSPQGVGR